jgi:type I restriction enzyme S subunit
MVETQKGYAFKSGWYCDTGRPIVKVSDFTNDSVDSSNLICIPETIAADYLKYELHTGDVVIQTVGSWPTNPASVVGKCVRIRINAAGALLNQNAVKLSPAHRLDLQFLFYLLRSEDFKTYIIGTAQGAASQAAITLEGIRGYEFDLPPLPVQKRIAGILSAYDELIENSQRRIRILEATARALYREWFVHFRFPGHDAPSSPINNTPQGWEVCTLGDFVQFKSGFAFKSGMFTADGEHRLVTIRNVQDGAFNTESDNRLSELPKKMPPFCMLEDGDILLSLTGNVGRVCLVYDGPFLLNQRVSKLVPGEAFDWAMTYCMFREPEMRIKLEQLSNGVAQQNLSPVLASKMEFARPPKELRQRFAAQAEPMVRRIVQLYSIAQNLRHTRDLLLPRLLSGQIQNIVSPTR